MERITIITPTFNRSDKIVRLYNSLREQTFTQFQWVIIDDGSTDSTNETIKRLQQDKEINIDYLYQENSGKAVALNKAFDSVLTELFVIVDSDDILLPTAVETLHNYLEKYKDESDLGGFFFHYKTQHSEKITAKKELSQDEKLTCFDYFELYGKHDGCLCYLKRAVDEYRYPEFESENYVGPTVLQMLMTEKYKIMYSPKIIGEAEYQVDGLTNAGRKLRLKNPKGMLFYNELKYKNEQELKKRIKVSVFIWIYSFRTNKRIGKVLRDYNLSLDLIATLIPSLVLNQYWRSKYKD